MVLRRRRRGLAGFSILELLVVLVIGLALMLITLPPLFRYTHRANLEQMAQETASLMLLARRQAIRSNVTTNVVFDFDAGQVYAYVDNNGSNTEDVGEQELGRYTLPEKVYFWDGQDVAPKGAHAVDPKWTTGYVCVPSCPNGGIVSFLPTGSIANAGSIHFGDKRDNTTLQGNFLEVGIISAATCKIDIKKWNPATSSYLLRDQNGTPWTWY
jgi:type II secretory pathway pseudopilin PulG